MHEIRGNLTSSKSDISTNSKEENGNGLYLNFMTYVGVDAKNKDGLFDFSNIGQKPEKIKENNIFISEKEIYIVIDEKDSIRDIKQHDEIGKNETMLFKIKKINEGFSLNCKIDYNLEPNLKNIKEINYKLWHVIKEKYDSDYYLKEGDIIKIGEIKLIVKKIFIRESQNKVGEEVKNQIFDLNPKIVDYKTDQNSGEKIFQFCSNKEHYEYLGTAKKWFDGYKMKKNENKDNKVNYYYIFEPFRCKKCNNILSLEYKYLNEEGEEEPIKFIDLKKPENSSYMILESLEYKSSSQEVIQKSFYVIKLIDGKKIKIGTEKENDIRFNHSSVSKHHAEIKYIDGKLLIKNKSKDYGTLLMNRQNEIIINNKKEMYLQVNRTYVEAEIMNMNEFDNKRNICTKYPITKKDDKKIFSQNDLPNEVDNKLDDYFNIHSFNG